MIHIGQLANAVQVEFMLDEREDDNDDLGWQLYLVSICLGLHITHLLFDICVLSMFCFALLCSFG